MNHKKWPPNGNLSQWILDQFEPGYRGHAIDVGASDGISISTTWALEKHHLWTVISVEANPDFAKMLKEERTWVDMCACSDKQSESEEFNINQDNPEAFSALRITDHKSIRDPTTREQLAGGTPKPWKKIQVRVETVNDLIEKWQFPKLDALCVDVEGGELEVLKGCDLDRWRPKVIVSEAWDAGREYPYLAAFGYKLVARNVMNDLYLLEDK